MDNLRFYCPGAHCPVAPITKMDTLITTYISNYIHYKFRDDITYNFQTSTVQILTFVNA